MHDFNIIAQLSFDLFTFQTYFPCTVIFYGCFFKIHHHSSTWRPSPKTHHLSSLSPALPTSLTRLNSLSCLSPFQTQHLSKKKPQRLSVKQLAKSNQCSAPKTSRTEATPAQTPVSPSGTHELSQGPSTSTTEAWPRVFTA